MPEQVRTIPTCTTKPTYYTEALREYLLERSNILGDDEQAARQPAVPRRAADPHHARPDPAGARRAGARTRCRTTAPASTRRSSRSTRRPARSARWSAAAASSRESNEINMALVPAPDRIEHQDLHPRRGAPGRRAAERPDRRHARRACCPNPDDPKQPVPDQASGEPSRSAPLSEHDVGVDQLRVRPAVADRRAAPRRRHDVPHGAARRTSTRVSRRTTRRPIQPYASFATGANEMSPLDMASGMQTIANHGLHHEPYYVDCIDQRRRHAPLHARRSRACRCSTRRRADRRSTC